ncbi:hypothetical protein SESBI_20462 [Sesbania bispinosa]|nr:hypothetical protein SESBI_20462 [Sesbania bispinosa]
MKCKNICFCIRGRNRKSKENEVEDLEKLSDDHKGKKEERNVSSTAPADDGASSNVHGASTVATNDAGVAAAAHHVSLMSGQDGSGHGGESAGGG